MNKKKLNVLRGKSSEPLEVSWVRVLIQFINIDRWLCIVEFGSLTLWFVNINKCYTVRSIRIEYIVLYHRPYNVSIMLLF